VHMPTVQVLQHISRLDPAAAPLLGSAALPLRRSKSSLRGEPEEATVHTARRVKVEDLGPRELADPSSAENLVTASSVPSALVDSRISPVKVGSNISIHPDSREFLRPRSNHSRKRISKLDMKLSLQSVLLTALGLGLAELPSLRVKMARDQFQESALEVARQALHSITMRNLLCKEHLP
jgi:hypothetical protein